MLAEQMEKPFKATVFWEPGKMVEVPFAFLPINAPKETHRFLKSTLARDF
jgi:hypothetical protein